MAMTDPIADMLTRIRNANQMRHPMVEMPASKIKKEILEVLKKEGFVEDVNFIEDNKQGILKVTLKYTPSKERVIKGIRRISKPGLRVYRKTTEIPKVLNGLGIAILSTSKGIVTDKVARTEKVGGEIIAPASRNTRR